MGIFIQYFGGMGQIGNVGLSWKRMYGMKKYVCTLCVILIKNGWRSQISCCMTILLSEEGRVVDNMQGGCFIELVVIYFF